MAATQTTTCEYCTHWDSDHKVTDPKEASVTTSRCTLAEENDDTAPLTIRHHQYANGQADCQIYLTTKSNFSCGAARRKDGILESEDQDPEDEDPKGPQLATKIAKTAADTTLWAADLSIDYMLRRRQDERTTRPTKRTRFSLSLKRQLLSEQNRQCMYCGERKSTKTTDIDHKDPVVRGGVNKKENLQILCKPCNQRKGMQTDEEFRERYAELLPNSRTGQKPQPPEQRIRQGAFRELTKETRMAETATQYKKTRYISPRQKISSGTPAAGGIVGIILFFGTALALPSEPWAANLSLAIGLTTGFGTWIGLMARAKYTGKLDI